MLVEQINKNNNIAMKGLYFSVIGKTEIDKDIKNAITKNPYIKSLSEKEDVIASFTPKSKDGLMQHVLILDVVDLKTNQGKKSMWYSSRLFGAFKDITPIEFINTIKDQTKTSKNGFLQKIFKKKNNPNQTKYYNYQEGLNYIDNILVQKLNISEQLKKAEQERIKLNIERIKNFRTKYISKKIF